MLEILKATSLFRGFSDDALRDLVPAIGEESFGAGESLFREGDVGTCLYIVVAGEIEIRKDEKTLAVLSPGALFGEMAAYLGRRTAGARARGPATLYRIDGEAMKAFLLEHSAESAPFLYEHVEVLSRRLAQTSDYLVTIFETGRIVGQDLELAEIGRRILEKLLQRIPDASGGMVLIANPFTESYEVAAAVTVSLLDEETAVALAERAVDELSCPVEGGIALRVPLKDQDQILGFILLEKPSADTPFDKQQEVIAMAVADQVSLGILQASHRQEERARQRLEQSRWRME